MKKFQFNLEKLLSYKDQMLDSEMAALTALNASMSQAKQTLSDLQMELEQCTSDFNDMISENATPAACRVYMSYSASLKEQIKLWEQEVEHIALRIEEKLQEIVELKLESKSLETIKSSRFQEYTKEIQKAEELAVEEFVYTSDYMKKTF